MEITLLSPNCIKIKGKNSSAIVDPVTLRTKTPSDAVILLKKDEKYDASKIEGARVVLEGPGEYEFSGVKVVAMGEKNTVYSMNVDGIEALVGNIEGIEKYKEKLKEHSIIIFFADSKFNDSLITALEPKVAIFYGENAQEAVDSLGKAETVKPVSKYSIKPENLPEEMETVLLG